MTPRQALLEALPLLRDSMEGDASACARWLLLDALETDMGGYVLRRDAPMAASAYARFTEMVRRCAAGEPVQYVLGWWEFAGLRLRTDSRALIPRPETELAARKAVECLEGAVSPAVMDIGCGTGCLGLYIAASRPDARVTLGDTSDGALSLTRENAAALALSVSVVRADMGLPLPGGPYDLVVSNPPYIESAAVDALPLMIRCQEPRLALDGGPDGLDAYRMLAGRFRDSLKPGGSMVLEVGAGQAEAVARMLSDAGAFSSTENDLAGIPRIVTARHP